MQEANIPTQDTTYYKAYGWQVLPQNGKERKKERKKEEEKKKKKERKKERKE